MSQELADTMLDDQPQKEKINLLGLSASRLSEFFEEIGEKKFRATQIIKWIHQEGECDFQKMTNLSKDLRNKLHQIAEIKLPEVVSCQESVDGTCKWLIRVDGGSCIEMVYIPERERGTLCVSSQIGCALDCSFCATGKQGFNRDLTSAEIIGQLWIAADSFDQFSPKAKRRVSNVVMMGMGEPLMNFDNVVDAMSIMLEDNAYGLSKRRVTLSTSGVVPELDKLGDVSDVSLAISLHAPNDELRNELVPINRKYPLATFIQSAKNYIEKMPDNRRKVTVEYTLMDQVNDRSIHARELAVLLKDLPCKINLIPFNPFAGSGYKTVTNTALNRFRDILMAEGYTVTVRTTRGDDIAAACGQLAGEVNDRTKRQERYKKKLNDIQPLNIME
ncbi:23S rRNA (adenine(2503)-C(2))-methyltransferase RlmN [Porticoccaceae bacterium]|jgi:23S rRNA (adenine2503-C2)-methyltransferase|nr:23S rRNA (adenine(2503)-C(2))-methyltransferase RlmN [Porticoccaceae bacterium]MBT7564728.1 23S rRNA (adenine(2503)-C(2))-methyltransferase RlmN [Porticoccaceae bacterium]MDA7589817.1 23S rRNA (adenine(2503)-C(2))-methyltransferase RlmN [Porticoccaceae bacterium]MDC3199944.1 23S rRNA (adenine(2503)-C(2))-methyltransferase RlmN [Porticoccaceae bacterium]MDC3258711.1 23S rRNA (adenine(2503)-C(2))-methyltransferase RlmN [Porticoccaceae bacterium]